MFTSTSSKKQLRKGPSRLFLHMIDPFGSLLNHSNVMPLRVQMNNRALTGSFPTMFPAGTENSSYAAVLTPCRETGLG